jgi:hypothetical protein
MSSSVSDKLQEIHQRIDLLERLVATPIVSKRDIRWIIFSLVAIAFVFLIGVFEQIYLLSKVSDIYSLLESV